MSDTGIYEKVAGDDGAAAQSLSEYLKAMESDELAQLADQLADLMVQPGWQRLVELLDLQAKTIKAAASRGIWGQFEAGKVIRDQGPFLRLGGVVDGLGRPQRTIRTVLAVHDFVQKRLGLDDGEAT